MFSLRTLFLIVTIAALGAAALIYQTPLWARSIVMLTLCVLVFALLRVHSHPSKRSFWVPVSIIGWIYFVAWFYGPLSVREYLPLTEPVYEWWYDQNKDLPGARLLQLMDKTNLFKQLMEYSWAGDAGDIAYSGLQQLLDAWAITHCLATLLLAFGGGAVYSWSVTQKKGGT